MSDYRDTLRLAHEIEAIRRELDAVTTREQVAVLEARTAALRVRVAEALTEHTATRPWYSRWLWQLRLSRFERAVGAS